MRRDACRTGRSSQTSPSTSAWEACQIRFRDESGDTPVRGVASPAFTHRSPCRTTPNLSSSPARAASTFAARGATRACPATPGLVPGEQLPHTPSVEQTARLGQLAQTSNTGRPPFPGPHASNKRAAGAVRLDCTLCRAPLLFGHDIQCAWAGIVMQMVELVAKVCWRLRRWVPCDDLGYTHGARVAHGDGP